jgi:hypothetical protein
MFEDNGKKRRSFITINAACKTKACLTYAIDMKQQPAQDALYMTFQLTKNHEDHTSECLEAHATQIRLHKQYLQYEHIYALYVNLGFLEQGKAQPQEIRKFRGQLNKDLQSNRASRRRTNFEFSSLSDTANTNDIVMTDTTSGTSAIDVFKTLTDPLNISSATMTKQQYTALDPLQARDWLEKNYMQQSHLQTRDKHQIKSLLIFTHEDNNLSLEARAHAKEQLVLMYYVARTSWPQATAFLKDVIEDKQDKVKRGRKPTKTYKIKSF